MPLKPQQITTEADTLITLLKEVKEMPLKDIAKKLHIPQETLEAWASFLEEEGVVSIKYNFTTPYLAYVGGAGKSGLNFSPDFKNKVDLIEKGSELENIENMLGSIDALIKQGDFPKLPENYDALISKLKDIKETLGDKAPENMQAVEVNLQDIEASLEQTHTLVDDGKFDDATKGYMQIHALLTNLLLELKTLQSDIAKKRISETNDVSKLLEEAYALMSEGKVEEASQIYQQLDAIYKELPHNYVEKKHEIERTIAKFNKDLAATQDKKRIADVQQGSASVISCLARCSDSLKKNDLADAEKSYLSARKIFTTLPPGFLAQKRRLQEGLINVYEQISSGREKMFQSQFNSAASQLSPQLEQINSLISEGKISNAIKLYSSAKKTFDLMPSGFLNEKLSLQSKLLSVYDKLVSAYQSSSMSEMQQKMTKIKALLQDIGKALGSANYDEATGIYTDIREIFKSMPPGFLKEKTDLQQKILNIYEQLITVSGQQMSKDVRLKVDEINKLLDEAFNYLKHSRDGLAHELYFQSINLYNTLPGGFLQSKAVLRDRMLNLYREIITRLDTSAREEFTESAEMKYREILRLIVNVRHFIAKKQFDLIEPEYRSIASLFSQLPIGFAQRSSQLLKEIKEISQEVKLYNLLRQLSSIAADDVLNQALNEIFPVKQFVSKECPEDVELIHYSEELYNQYVRKMMDRKTETGSPEQIPTAPDSELQQEPSNNQYKQKVTDQKTETRKQEPIFPGSEQVPLPPRSSNPPQAEGLFPGSGIDELEEKIRQLKQKAKPSVVMPSI